MDNNKKLRPFTPVLVRDFDDDEWRANIFSHYKEDTKKYVCTAYIWRYCIPYEGNEDLVGTDKSPKCEREELNFLQKVTAWNSGLGAVRGYFLDKITVEGGKIHYKIINPKNKDTEWFQHCIAEEWEE